MSYKNKLVTALFVLPLVAMAITGCDRHKAERAELGKQIAVIEADLVPLQEEQGRVSSDLQTLTSEVQQQSDTLQPHLDRLTQLQDELDQFVQEHQTTALVLKLTKTGVAAVLDSNANEKTKNLIRTADTIGKLVAVAYCFKKGEECRNATIKITSLGSQIDSENATISGLTEQLDQKKASRQELQQKVSSVDAAIAAKTNERDALKQKLVSLS